MGLSSVPASWCYSLILAAVGLALYFFACEIYKAGYEKAEVEGRAEIAALRSQHDRAYAQAVENLNTKLREQTRRALAVNGMLETERTNNAKEQAGLRARIASITADSRHTFSPDFVRVWNEATGAFRSNAVPETGNTPRADGAPGTCKTTGAVLLATGTVTEADVLAYIIYYGPRCKNIEAQVNAWIDIAEGEGWHESR